MSQEIKELLKSFSPEQLQAIIAQASTPKKRGRPAKEKVEAKVAEAPKKRGRPAKVVSAPVKLPKKVQATIKTAAKDSEIVGSAAPCVFHWPSDVKQALRAKAEGSKHRTMTAYVLNVVRRDLKMPAGE